LKKRASCPADAVDHIDPKLSAAENFIVLNKISGNRRCLVPMSSFGDKFVPLSENDLTRVFWHDTVLEIAAAATSLSGLPIDQFPR